MLFIMKDVSVSEKGGWMCCIGTAASVAFMEPAGMSFAWCEDA